jgi:hypothetical protein
MTNALLQIKIKQRLNKLASLDYDNIECWQIQEAFNKAQLEWVRRQVYGMNLRKEGAEQSTGLIDDLRVLLKTAHTQNPEDKKLYAVASLPADYLYYTRIDVLANSDCCPDKRRMTVYEVEEANIAQILNSDQKNPNFEWAETVSTLVGDKLRVYTEGKFSITDIYLIYYSRPVDIKFQGCIDPSTGSVIKQDVTCIFKDDIVEILADETAAILAGDIESMNQYPRETQNSQRNS